MHKKLIVFEGLGCSGKSTLIKKLHADLFHLNKVEVLDSKHQLYVSKFYNRSGEIAFEKDKYAYFCFRWTRLFLFINHIIISNSEIYLLDRGFLTGYIYGKVDKIHEPILLGIIDEILNLLNNAKIDYITVFLECDLEIANARFSYRQGIDYQNKITRNILFDPYLKNIDNYSFVHKLLTINSNESVYKDYENTLNFISK